MHYQLLDSPLGPLLIHAADHGLRGIHFVDEKYYPGIGNDWIEDGSHSLLFAAAAQLREYFAGQRTTFDLPLDPQGTAFQRNVWQALQQIPYGETLSYGQLARRIGDIKAVRAVGAANGRNPISIVVPCHRVIGADGGLTGYAGGLPRKQALLRLENRQASFTGFEEAASTT